MGWWAGWFGDKIYDDSIPPDGTRARRALGCARLHHLPLGHRPRLGADAQLSPETDFRRLAQVMPAAVVIDGDLPLLDQQPALTGPFSAACGAGRCGASWTDPRWPA
ncbi:MAG: hypothetical protein R2851_08670 [Caldilineaceae bacterium]